MDRKELETYEVQLSQVEMALLSDPSNTELTSLRDELKELISLTKTALEEAEKAAAKPAEPSRKTASSSQHATSSKVWAAGDECFAKYSEDGNWYPARITSVGGSEEHRVYSVVFKGYNTTEILPSSSIKPPPASYVNNPASHKRKLTKEEETEKERKKRKNEKKDEVRAEKAKEQMNKQQAWQKFAKKGEKKGVHIAGLEGRSIFKTPENPLGRGQCRSKIHSNHVRRILTYPSLIIVGVTGSGQGMTETISRTKHKFVPTDSS
jgi:survival-of-motor-neuron-related-splicing factor 30